MGITNFIKNLFGRKEELRTKNEPLTNDTTSNYRPLPKQQDAGLPNLSIGGTDLMKMTHKLVKKGEYLRAEQLIRDGVKELADSPDIWWLLLQIEEPLKRQGRLFYCVEQLLIHEPENEELLERHMELKGVLDKQLEQFIEYKLAPEFFKLK